jgi:hypothetical protein
MNKLVFIGGLALFTCAIAGASAGMASGGDLETLYESGEDFDTYVEWMIEEDDIWKRNRAEATIPADVEFAARRIPGQWRLLIVSEELCLDAQNTVPYIAALADSMPRLELRVVDSNKGREVTESRRTPDDRGATPTVVILDKNGADAGCWIERPAALTTFYMQNKLALGDADAAGRERLKADYKDWYERDAGATTLREVVALIDAAARGARGCSAPKTKTAGDDTAAN